MKCTVSFEGKPTSPVELTLSMTVSEWKEFKKKEVAEAIEWYVMAEAEGRKNAIASMRGPEGVI